MVEQPLIGKKILVTAGSTREPIDPIRYLSNCVDYRIGYELTEALLEQGAMVYLVSGYGKVSVSEHPMLTVVNVETASEMYLACCKFFEDAEIAIFTAAIPEYKPKEIMKTYNKEVGLTIKMVKNIDIPAAFANAKKEGQLIVSYLSQTSDDYQNAVVKMDCDNIDMLIVKTVYGNDKTDETAIGQTSIIKNNRNVYNLPMDITSVVVKEVVSSLQEMIQQPANIVQHKKSGFSWPNIDYAVN